MFLVIAEIMSLLKNLGSAQGPFPFNHDYPLSTDSKNGKNPNSEDSENHKDLIQHEYLDILGSTTNTLIYCLLDNSPNKEFTRWKSGIN